MTKEEKKEFKEIFGKTASPKLVKKGMNSIFETVDDMPGINIFKGDTDKNL